MSRRWFQKRYRWILPALVMTCAAFAEETSDPAFEQTAHEVLSDLSARRRVTTLFENKQSVLYGVQENYVNTSRGNLTFLVRDLVRVAAMPIVFGRVYDSSHADDADFGPGWKLSVREQIRDLGSHLEYTDASNSTYVLVRVGSDVVPQIPSITPIESGTALGASIELRSDGLVRTYARSGDTYRLTEARNNQGGLLRLSYRGGRIVRISSGRASIEIQRRHDGRIVGALDDLGRQVTYTYDESDQLIEVKDLAGETTRYAYQDRGALSTIEDPRSSTMFEATYLADGRALAVRALRKETELDYSDATTRIVDTLGRTSTFYHGANGLTTGVSDHQGRLTQLEFDDALRPTAMRADGAVIARLEYDDQGRLKQIDRPSETVEYRYNDGGDLVAMESASWEAEFGYDSEGRVTSVSDAAGQRQYRYDENGALSELVNNDHKLGIHTSQDGVIERIVRGDDALLTYSHAPSGRITSITHGETGAVADYRYNARGFRDTFDYTDAGGSISALARNDSVGNLVHLSFTFSETDTVTQDFEVSEFNDLIRVRRATGPDTSYFYDSAGRVLAAESGGQTATFEYDDLDRILNIKMDGEILAEWSYDRSDPDAAQRQDRRTGDVMVPHGISGVFGTMESIVYTRPVALDYGPIAYVPELKSFEVLTDDVNPDALLLSSLARRVIPLNGEAVNVAPFGYDKPSNSLFIPPEFRSVNCYSCSYTYIGAWIMVGAATVGQPVDMVFTPGLWCSQSSGGYGGYGSAWHHHVTFGDGSSTDLVGFSGVGTAHTYSSSGTKNINDVLRCGCSLFTTTLAANVTVSQPACSIDFDISPTTPAISATPAMPSLTATVTSVTSGATISWSATVSHTAPAGCTGGPTFSDTATGGNSQTFAPSFSGFFGGDVTITASCTAPNHSAGSRERGTSILGTQPSIPAIVSKIGSVASPFESTDLCKISSWESGLTQFTSGGLPVYGPGGDTGLMQICFSARIRISGIGIQTLRGAGRFLQRQRIARKTTLMTR